jgi:hypothetical protein
VPEYVATVSVSAADLRIGDVIRWPDGRCYAVDAVPQPDRYPEEYSEPMVAIRVTEIDEDMTPVADAVKQALSPDIVVDVLTPRPN